MIKDKLKQKPTLAAAIAVLFILLCVSFTPIYTTVTLTFAEDPSGEVITTVYAGPRKPVVPSDAKSRVVNSAVARISFLDIQYGGHCSLKRIDPVDQGYDGTLTITGMSVRQNGVQTLFLNEETLRTYFYGNDQVQFTDDSGFSFTVTGTDPQLFPNEEFQNMYARRHLPVLLLSILLFGGAGLLLLALIDWFLKELQGLSLGYKLAGAVFLGGLLGSVILCVYTGLRSPFWLNPDEYDVKAAVLYYFSHLRPPDIRSDIINDSFPVYGTSRHFEWNLFYFYAGRLGRYFSDAAVQIRLFSLCLFALMTGIALRNMKKNHALLYVLLLTPQVWYIFSYSTSDALDFFMGFLSLYELIEEKSMLNRVLNEPLARRQAPSYVLLSVLFVHLLWAKASFYPILVFLFLILLIRMFALPKEERRARFQKYLILLGLTLGIFVVRYLITDYPYYGFNKLGVVIEVTERHAEYGYKPSTPPLLQAYSMSFFGKGITLKELLTQYEFHKNLFRTFAGFFGTYTFGERDWYYLAMGALYLALLGYLLYRYVRSKDRQKLLELAAVAFSCFLQYALIVFNSWFIDFQPQGRYLLPVLFFIAYLIARVDRFGKDKVLRGILICTCILSLYAFLHVGIPNLVPDQVILP